MKSVNSFFVIVTLQVSDPTRAVKAVELTGSLSYPSLQPSPSDSRKSLGRFASATAWPLLPINDPAKSLICHGVLDHDLVSEGCTAICSELAISMGAEDEVGMKFAPLDRADSNADVQSLQGCCERPGWEIGWARSKAAPFGP